MSDPCAIWRSATYKSGSGNSTYQFHSPRAGGVYEITGKAKMRVEELSDEQKARLTTWLVDQHTAGNRYPLVTDAEIDRASNAAPKTVEERRDRLGNPPIFKWV